jgi:uncharacterized protein
MDSEIFIYNNPESRSYDAVLEDRVVGTIVYELRDNRMVIRHTVVAPEFRGQGIAKALAQFALDDLAEQGTALTNYCGFISDYIERNPRYAGLIDVAKPGRAHPRDAAMRAAGQQS